MADAVTTTTVTTTATTEKIATTTTRTNRASISSSRRCLSRRRRNCRSRGRRTCIDRSNRSSGRRSRHHNRRRGAGSGRTVHRTDPGAGATGALFGRRAAVDTRRIPAALRSHDRHLGLSAGQVHVYAWRASPALARHLRGRRGQGRQVHESELRC